MELQLLYLARLREAFGLGGERWQASPEVADVASLLAALRSRGGVWSEELAPQKAFRVAVNHDMAQAATPLKDGDEVAIFPPVTGG